MTMAEPDLHRWLLEALDAAAGGSVDASPLGADSVGILLDVAREAAHAVARPAAPLSAFAVGLALGRSGQWGDLEEAARRVTALAHRWRDGE